MDHALEPGARSTYFMTGPEGEKYCGVWDIKSVDRPTAFTFADAFADEEFNVQENLPVSVNSYAFASEGEGTRATYTSTYASAEALQQVLDMGVVEGASAAINQIDELLAD